MFARNLKNPRTAEPELDKNSLASLGLALASSFKVPAHQGYRIDQEGH